MNFFTTILKKYTSIPTAFKTGQRLSKIRGEGFGKGVSYALRKSHKNVGTLPLVTAGIGVCCAPIPGTAALGFTVGSMIQEGVKVGAKLMKIG